MTSPIDVSHQGQVALLADPIIVVLSSFLLFFAVLFIVSLLTMRRSLLPADGLPFPPHIVQRFRDEHPEQAPMADAIAVELQRWLRMTASVRGRLPMRGIVDEMWHLFVLDTKAYAAYCRTAFARFVDHIPSGLFVAPAGAWDDFHDAYERRWHRSPPAGIWPPRTGETPTPRKTSAAAENGGGSGPGGGADVVVLSSWTGRPMSPDAGGGGGDGWGGCGGD